jgi:hypothetical protein
VTFVYGSTCFGHFPAHHQELNDCSGSLWFYHLIVVTVVLCSWSGRPQCWRKDKSLPAVCIRTLAPRMSKSITVVMYLLFVCPVHRLPCDVRKSSIRNPGHQFVCLTVRVSALCRPAQPRTQHDYHHDTKVKPEAATAVSELLMMGGKTP